MKLFCRSLQQGISEPFVLRSLFIWNLTVKAVADSEGFGTERHLRQQQLCWRSGEEMTQPTKICPRLLKTKAFFISKCLSKKKKKCHIIRHAERTSFHAPVSGNLRSYLEGISITDLPTEKKLSRARTVESGCRVHHQAAERKLNPLTGDQHQTRR